MAKSTEIPVWHRFVAGTASGVALVLVGHPLDTLKVKMQLASGSAPPSLGTVLRSIVRTEGLRGFYRGFLPPLLFTGGINTVLWGLQFSFTDALARSERGGGPTTRAMLAAVASGLLVSVIVTPIEGIKTRMQAAAAASSGGAKSSSSEGTLAVVRRVLREGGIRRVGLCEYLRVLASDAAHLRRPPFGRTLPAGPLPWLVRHCPRSHVKLGVFRGVRRGDGCAHRSGTRSAGRGRVGADAHEPPRRRRGWHLLLVRGLSLGHPQGAHDARRATVRVPAVGRGFRLCRRRAWGLLAGIHALRTPRLPSQRGCLCWLFPCDGRAPAHVTCRLRAVSAALKSPPGTDSEGPARIGFRFKTGERALQLAQIVFGST